LTIFEEKILTNPVAGSYEFIVLLSLAFRSQIDTLHLRLSEAGHAEVRPAHGFTFQLLATNGGATGNEIAEHLGVTKQAASQMIEFLEQRGYVVRKPYPGDGRGKLVVLTDKAWDCINKTEVVLTELESKWAEFIGQERMADLRLSLRHLVQEAYGGVIPNRLRPVW